MTDFPVKQTKRKPTGAAAMGPGPGRPKGSENKITRTAKEAIALAADGLGGAERLVAWAKEDPLNERAFWATIYPKLLPLQVNGAGDNGEHLVGIKVEFVSSSS